jgi:hypothetical protein
LNRQLVISGVGLLEIKFNALAPWFSIARVVLVLVLLQSVWMILPQ